MPPDLDDVPDPIRAGLAETAPATAGVLREAGLDPERLAIHQFGRDSARHAIHQPWARRVGIGLLLWLGLEVFEARLPAWSLAAGSLIVIGCVLLSVFGVYLYKLVDGYAREESTVADSLELTAEAIDERKSLVYMNVHASSWSLIAMLFLAGIAGSLRGGERVAHFAHAAIADLGLNSILTALILAIFAGMSEYVILWKSHRKGNYGIALANAFGGITQVMFLVLPFTLIAIGVYQGWINPAHPQVPLEFSLPNILLLLFLFPTFFVLIELLEEDHTLGILDTTIMVAIFALLIVLLVTYGAGV